MAWGRVCTVSAYSVANQMMNQLYREYEYILPCWHFTLGTYLAIATNETRALIANLPSSEQLVGSAYHSPKLHPGLCSSVRIWRRRHTDDSGNNTFHLAMPNVKCNIFYNVWTWRVVPGIRKWRDRNTDMLTATISSPTATSVQADLLRRLSGNYPSANYGSERKVNLGLFRNLMLTKLPQIYGENGSSSIC